MRNAIATRIISSYHHTPSELERRLFYSVLRAGHIRTASDYRVQRDSYPGHDLLLCIGGSGTIQVGSRSFPVCSGELGWLNCCGPHAHWPSASAPWELLWMRVDSAQFTLIAEALDVETNPVFALHKLDEAVGVFQSACKLLRSRPLNVSAALHAAVSSLTAILFDARQSAISERPTPRAERAPPADLAAVLDKLRVEYGRRWRVKDLAQLAGISVPQFFRRFNQMTGSSPMDWLRRHRVNEAKRRLSETRDHISNIANQVGYADPLYFSRDFKKVVGVSPRRYRETEQAKVVIWRSG